jgi:signal peptidase I
VSADEASEEEGPGLWEQFGSLLVAVAIALAIRTFVVEPFRIPSESMLPTLLVGDHLFVNKFAYGARIPFTDVRLPGLREPERGDIVVFTVARDPRDPTRICPVDRCPGKPTEEFVKRIVGLPGETVEVRPDGSVRIDGRLLEVTATGTSFENGAGTELAVREEHNGRCHYSVLDDRRLGSAVKRVTVEPGRYFMMGDNRDHSNDSRGWGTVRALEFRGPALFLYWSWDYNGGWLELLNPLTWVRVDKRWSRFGDGLGCAEEAPAPGAGDGAASETASPSP